MKKLIDIESVNRCITEGINTPNAIAEKLGFSCAAIQNFCERKGIELQKKPRGGGNCIEMAGELKNGVRVIRRVAADPALSKSRFKLAKWECRCPCGNLFEAVGADIRQNRVKTCGCRTSIVTKRNWQGGKHVSRLYWQVLNGNARQRELELSVSIEYLDALFEQQGGVCALSGLPLKFSGKKILHTASLDRKDSSIGYVEGNVQWVHKHINLMKKDHSDEYFIELCRKVTESNERFRQAA